MESEKRARKRPPPKSPEKTSARIAAKQERLLIPLVPDFDEDDEVDMDIGNLLEMDSGELMDNAMTESNLPVSVFHLIK